MLRVIIIFLRGYGRPVIEKKKERKYVIYSPKAQLILRDKTKSHSNNPT